MLEYMEGLAVDLPYALLNATAQLGPGLVHGEQDAGDLESGVELGLHRFYQTDYVRDAFADEEVSLWIKQIEDDYRGIVFSDGTFTAGRRHCTKEARQWLARCGERKVR